MATVWRGTGSWAAPGDYFGPGEEHHWWMTGFVYADTISVTAHPISDRGMETVVAVEDVRTLRTTGDPTLLFTVRNKGTHDILAYLVSFGFISK